MSPISSRRMAPWPMAPLSLSTLLIAAFAWLLAFAPAVQAQPRPDAAPQRPAFFLEDASPRPLVPTVEAFTETVRAHGWSMLSVMNMAGVLSERGFTVLPVLILEPCSGRFSADLLDNDETRFVASMIPCRVAIYQLSDGRIIISRLNSAAMGEMIGGHAGAVIRESGAELERIIRATLERLARP